MLAKKRKKIKNREKTPKQLERHLKGIANYRRIEIIFLISDQKGITIEDISDRLSCNIKTISGHTQKLVYAGLVRKKYFGRQVEHELSPYGKILVSLIKTFQYSREC